ncbi:MAG: efflux RND transporter periplasmic adaptor subunit, partial [Bacteroidales bacterium]
MKNTKLVFFVIIALSCQKKIIEEKSGDSMVIARLKDKQIQEAGIKTDSIRKRLFPGTYSCQGYFSIHPNKMATVTTPVNGFIKKMFYNSGDYVKKGALLAVLRHQDYIKIQKEYIEAKNQVDYYVEDFKRQGELSLEHAASLKKMQKAQTDYWANEAKMRALKAQMELIGIDAEKVEKEGFTTSINIYAPVSGYITRVDGNIGKFVDSYAFIYEIASIDELLLSFELPGALYYKVHKNMAIKFSLSEGREILSGAKIKSIGQVFNTETNTVNIIARPDSANKTYRPGMSVKIIINSDDELRFSLPEEAIIRSKNNSYIFIKDKNTFIRALIETGMTYNTYTIVENTSD